jgi:hypothetical protein
MRRHWSVRDVASWNVADPPAPASVDALRTVDPTPLTSWQPRSGPQVKRSDILVSGQPKWAIFEGRAPFTRPPQETMSSVLPTTVRVAVTLLAIAGTAGQVAYLDALWWHSLGLADTMVRDVSGGLILYLAAHAVVSVASALLAVLLVQREGPRERAARALGTAFGAWSYLMAYSGVVMLFRPDPGAARDVFEAHFLIVEMLGLIALVRFTALFPRPLVPSEIERSPTLPGLLSPVHDVSLWMLRTAAPWIAGAVVIVGLWTATLAAGGSIADAGLSRVMHGVRFIAAGLGVLNLRRSWGRVTGEDRRRLEWLVAGLSFLFGALALMIGGNVLVSVAGFRAPDIAWQPLVIDVGLVGFLGGVALGVLYDGPVDPTLVVRRVATVSAMGTLGLFLAAGLEALLAGGILAAFSLRAGVGTALALATVVSTYRALVRLVDRVLTQA